MATLTKGQTFAGAETVTATKLNNLVDNATIANIVNADIGAGAAIALSKLATGALPTGITVDSANIVDGTIVDADVSAAAAIGLSKLATGALPTGITVASANIVDGTIVNADINASAAIALSKLATGALPTAITVASANIVDGTIVNADVSASAAIAGTKVAPDFGAQNVVTTGTLGAGATTLGGNLTLGDNNIVAGTGAGTKIGTATTQKLGFYNATPIVQPAGADQAAVATTAATDVTPFGYTEAQANAIVALVNEMRSVLVNLGLMKGAA